MTFQLFTMEHEEESLKKSIAHPHHGIIKLTQENFIAKTDNELSFVLPRRVSSHLQVIRLELFTPLLKKYKFSLLLVFVSSLLAQMFGLAIPIATTNHRQSLKPRNLSSLNILWYRQSWHYFKDFCKH